MGLSSDIRAGLLETLCHPVADEAQERAQLDVAFGHLAHWRSLLVANTWVARQGTRVMQGPFAGLEFLARSAEGCHVPKLIGCYEQPLHGIIERAVATPYEIVLNLSLIHI